MKRSEFVQNMSLAALAKWQESDTASIEFGQYKKIQQHFVCLAENP